jgi:hypothetical protein
VTKNSIPSFFACRLYDPFSHPIDSFVILITSFPSHPSQQKQQHFQVYRSFRVYVDSTTTTTTMPKKSQKEELDRIQSRLDRVRSRRGNFDDAEDPPPPPTQTLATPSPTQTISSSSRGEGASGAWESVNLSSPKGRQKGFVSPKGGIRKGASAIPGSSRMVWQESPKPTSKAARSPDKKFPSSRRIVGQDQRINLMDQDNPLASPGFSLSPIDGRAQHSSIAGLFRGDLGARSTNLAPPFEDEFNDAAANTEAEEYLDSDVKKRHRLSPILASVLGFFTDSYAAVKYRTDRIYLSCLRRRGMTDPKQLFRAVGLVVLLVAAVFGLFSVIVHIGVDAQRSNNIQKILVAADVTSQEVFDMTDKNSPQNQALRWIAKEDSANLPTDHPALLDRYILAVFYFSSNTESWVSLDNWMTKAGHCSWHGIQCVARDAESQESGISKTYDDSDFITQIELVNNRLEGTIPAEFGKLSHMLTMDLSDNELSGSLPEFHGNLRYLMLRKNKFDGSIPESVTKLTNLHGIDLSANRYEGKVPTDLGDLKRLRYLMLSENQLTGSFPQINEMYSITKLHLDDNSFSGSIPTFLQEFDRLGTYSFLVDSFERHKNWIGTQLPALIEQTVSFRLDNNKLSGPFPKQSLGKLFNLEVLSLGGNEFTGTIPDVFDFIHRLTSLHLNNNKFKGTIPASLGHLSGISKFQKQSLRCHKKERIDISQYLYVNSHYSSRQ